MKKRIIFMFFALLAITSFAQEKTEHLKFKGVPINGTLSSFTQKIKQKGLKYQGTKDKVAMFEGEFAGEANCIIMAFSSTDQDLVSKVSVMFPSFDKWRFLYNQYTNMKSMLIQKYGEPISSQEEFQGYSQPNDDNEKLYSLEMDKCVYVTDFETQAGYIEVRILHQDLYGSFVSLLYIDKQNNEVMQSNAIDDL